MGTDAAGERHLDDGDRDAAIRAVVNGGHMTGIDQGADQIARLALGGQVDRRRRPFLAAMAFAKPERLADMAVGLADQTRSSPPRP
jgi:hypothetical protein